MTLAVLAFAIASLLPLFAMLPRVTAEDLAKLSDPRILHLLGRTFTLGFGVASLALALGLPFGFLVARTDIPGAALWRALGVAPLFLPTLLMATTWALMLPDLRGAPMTILSLGLSSFPLVAVFSARAFERIDRRLEESARLLGGARAIFALDLPLVLPAALAGACIAFTFAVNDFGVPDYVSSVGPKFNVYADQIFADWGQTQRPGLAVASSLPLIAMALLSLIPVLALRRRGALASLGQRFEPPGRFRLGAWRWPALGFVLGVLALSVFLPLGQLIFEAGRVRGEAFGLANLPNAFGNAINRARLDLARSLFYGLAAASAATLLGLILGHAIERSRSKLFSRGLELASLLPLAAPATLFGIGIIVTWSRPATADFYGSDWMAILTYTGRLTAFSVLLLSGAVASLPLAQEEAAEVAGAGPTKRLFGIVAPPLVPTLLASFALVFAFALRELDTSLLVPAANRTTILRVFNGIHIARDETVAALSLILIFLSLLPAVLIALFSTRRMEVLP